MGHIHCLDLHACVSLILPHREPSLTWHVANVGREDVPGYMGRGWFQTATASALRERMHADILALFTTQSVGMEGTDAFQAAEEDLVQLVTHRVHRSVSVHVTCCIELMWVGTSRGSLLSRPPAAWLDAQHDPEQG